MPLLTLPHPVPPFANTIRRSMGRPIIYDPRFFVMSPALIRFSTDAVRDLLGYQLAAFMGIPVLPHVGFWCPDDVQLRRGRSRPGRIGIAVAWDDPVRITAGWCHRALSHPETVARCLAMSLLVRHSDIDLGMTRKGLVAFDFGGIFPFYIPERRLEWKFAEQYVGYIDSTVDEFMDETDDNFDTVLEQVERFGLEVEFRRAIEGVLEAPYMALESCFDLSPHPMSELITASAVALVRSQFGDASIMV
jgi:hypothetical protein